MGDGAGAGEGEEGAGGCAEDSCRVLHSPRIPCLRMLPRVVWLVLCGMAEPGHYRERPHVFHQEAVVLEEAGGEGDGVVVHVGLVGVDVFAKQECVGVAVAVEDESIGGWVGAGVEFVEEVVCAGGVRPVLDEVVALLVEAERIGVVGADGLEGPIGVVGQEWFLGGEDGDVVGGGGVS